MEKKPAVKNVARPSPSPATRKALVDGLRDFTDSEHFDRALNQTEALGIRVFTIGIADLEDGSIGKSVTFGWQFLAEDASGTAVAAEVTDGEAEAELTSFSDDPSVAENLQALTAAEKKIAREHPNEQYELRILRIPAILLEAFWFASASGVSDLFVPYLTFSSQLEKGKAYGIRELTRVAIELSKEFLEFDSGYEQSQQF